MSWEPSVAAPGGHGALQRFLELAEGDPDGAFIAVDGEVCNRRDFLDGVAMGTGALAMHGVGEGDHVALVMPNSVSWCVRFWAAVNLGAIPAPLDPRIGAWELQNFARLLDIKLWAIVPRFRSSDIAGSILRAATKGPPFIVTVHGEGGPGLTPTPVFLQGATPAPVAARAPGVLDDLMLVCESGAGGNPQIIAVPHLGFVRSQQDMAVVLGLSHDDRMLLGLPLFHHDGFAMGLQALLSGASAHYVSEFDPAAFLDVIEQRRITVVQLTAATAQALLATPGLSTRDLSSVRLVYFAGEPPTDELARQFWQGLGIRAVSVIGSPETGSIAMWDSAADSAHPVEDCLPLPFTRALVCGDDGAELKPGARGHLWVSSDGLLREFFGNDGESTSRLVRWEGRRWFDTEDLAVSLPGGRIRLAGRLRRVVSRGANLVHCEEIELFLLTRRGVAAAVVMPGEGVSVERMVAYVRPAPGATLDAAELKASCSGNLADDKTPDEVVVVDQLPAFAGHAQHRRPRRP